MMFLLYMARTFVVLDVSEGVCGVGGSRGGGGGGVGGER